ncbi:MAG TPA: PilT/PilU family type 4a pilus ATPase [Candidatus Hydrogenedentes bacterium]|nr:PilT/PilU family type 4a pilus ATPase [Candidatus Hydrogenedentota bacterium]HIB54962.1 PilT/PilU family type 4a pilus ATPase [Nitrospirales bacterium]HIO70105.1 PilT/PilU family type 4a pilus ATPase [Nitrospirales bacterium]
METMDELLLDAVDKKASDIHLKTDNPPIFRLDGTLTRMDGAELTNDDVETLLSECVTTKDMAKFTKLMELDSSYTLPGKARFRINACRDDGDARVVLRIIPVDILSIETLKLPDVLKPLTEHRNGLVLVTGPTGSGKSTSLAAMIDYINVTRPEHIITVEDPLEFLHADKKSIITQRAVGQDTLSFANALRGALRQDPDIILIGEMRDAETVGTSMSSAETGHLVFSTLHTVSAVETINRVLDFFEPHQQEQVRKQLGTVIRGILSQRIIKKKDGVGRCVAMEIMLGTRTIRDFIVEGKSLRDLTRIISEGKEQYGMQTFDQALYDHHEAGTISKEVALANASSPKDLSLRFQGLG